MLHGLNDILSDIVGKTTNEDVLNNIFFGVLCWEIIFLKAQLLWRAGGGHAGIEACLAISRMGGHATLVTIDPNQ